MDGFPFFISFIFVAVFNMVEGLLVFFCIAEYFPFLLTLKKIKVDRSLRPEVFDTQKALSLKAEVMRSKVSDDGKCIWLSLVPGGSWLMIGYRGAVFPTKWNLSNDRSKVDTIEFKMPWGPIMMWILVLCFFWTAYSPMTAAIITLIIAALLAKGYKDLNIDHNPKLKTLMEKMVVPA